MFEIVGVDLAGPLYLRNGQKACILLYTCAVYRTIHLELITSLTTEVFLQSLRRFIARCGRPTTVYSVSGTNFKGDFCMRWIGTSSFQKLQKNKFSGSLTPHLWPDGVDGAST
ncbi:hypothetical protein AVEN_173354-1 [Araneus ventricosus]|uniref:Integrase catalytic domain-containing protein n=1 Tax=Araneus ventricosus TaxID=182803 RepID=A0A4Y2IB40_ARAVE|nr:hypothetical protein AVEN_173354-1 [Araneus ventricosus]